MAKRAAIPKSVRFEVFKRDSFKCQYCGAVAPDVLLVIDHIKAVAKGGDNDIMNLITACDPCNAGKRDVLLDDRTAISKARGQMEELQERREQLDMLMQWRQGLRDLDTETVAQLCAYWEDRTPGWSVNENGKKNLRKWLRQFTLEEVTHAMDVAADSYLEHDKEGKVTVESWEKAFSKIPGVCRVERAAKDDPDVKDLYYFRGILRRRLEGYYYDDGQAIRLLRDARNAGVPMDWLKDIVLNARGWRRFQDDLFAAMDEVTKADASEKEGESS